MREVLLSELSVGNTVHILAGEGDHTTEYRLAVLEQASGSSIGPMCELSQRPAGEDYFVGPVEVRVAGYGEDSPSCVEETFSEREHRLELAERSLESGPCNGILRVGNTVVVVDSRTVTEPPRGRGWHELTPEITAIDVVPGGS